MDRSTPYPFVGRSDELDALLAAYAGIVAPVARAQTGSQDGAHGHLAVVEGEAGIGKTRLAAEFLARVRAGYAKLSVAAEVAPFFPDLPERIAAAHLVVSRSGAGTVAELAAIGRPSILVPLPGALDQDQFANAGVLASVRNGVISVGSSPWTSSSRWFAGRSVISAGSSTSLAK